MLTIKDWSNDIAIGIDLNKHVSILLRMLYGIGTISANARESASSWHAACIPLVVIVTPNSIAVDRSYSRFRRHTFSRDDDDISALLFGQLAQIVE